MLGARRLTRINLLTVDGQQLGATLCSLFGVRALCCPGLKVAVYVAQLEGTSNVHRRWVGKPL